jgi:hypothetical protein
MCQLYSFAKFTKLRQSLDRKTSVHFNFWKSKYNLLKPRYSEIRLYSEIRQQYNEIIRASILLPLVSTMALAA